MHYKNGREAKNGDVVMVFPSHGKPFVGVMYDSVAGNDFCNGKVVPISPSDPMINLQEALHIDDVKGALPNTPDGRGETQGILLKDVPDTSKSAA